MTKSRMFAVALASLATGAAWAGPAVPLGNPLGNPLGISLGAVLGTFLPVAGGSVLVVAAVALVAGIRVARRKRNRPS